MPTKPRRSPRPQERQRDAERTRALILDAAAAEFGAHGFAGARIGAIAARAGVNAQLISYYFDGKEGLYRAMAQLWELREQELVNPGMTLADQARRYVLEALNNPDSVRLFAWAGLEYTGPDGDIDQERRTERLRYAVEQVRARQSAGAPAAALDPACLVVMLMAAAMAPTTLPHVIDGVCGTDARSPEFIEYYATQVTLLARLLEQDADLLRDEVAEPEETDPEPVSPDDDTRG